MKIHPENWKNLEAAEENGLIIRQERAEDYDEVYHIVKRSV